VWVALSTRLVLLPAVCFERCPSSQRHRRNGIKNTVAATPPAAAITTVPAPAWRWSRRRGSSHRGTQHGLKARQSSGSAAALASHLRARIAHRFAALVLSFANSTRRMAFLATSPMSITRRSAHTRFVEPPGVERRARAKTAIGNASNTLAAASRSPYAPP